MFAASKKTQASVLSLAGAPSFGSCWMKSSMAGTISYAGSSRTPSRRSPAASLTARTVARRSASRAITAGGDGGGGRSTAPVTAKPAPAAAAGLAVSSRSGVPGTGSDCAWATSAPPAGARSARSAPTPATIRQRPRGRCAGPDEPQPTAPEIMGAGMPGWSFPATNRCSNLPAPPLTGRRRPRRPPAPRRDGRRGSPPSRCCPRGRRTRRAPRPCATTESWPSTAPRRSPDRRP